MLLLVTALSRSLSVKRSNKDFIKGDIFINNYSSFKVFFVLHTVALLGLLWFRLSVSLDYSKYFTKKFCLLQWISIASGIQLCTFPKEMKSECSQADIWLCLMIWKKQQLLGLKDHCTHHLILRLTTSLDRPLTSVLVISEYVMPQESRTLLQVLSGETACEWCWDLV